MNYSSTNDKPWQLEMTTTTVGCVKKPLCVQPIPPVSSPTTFFDRRGGCTQAVPVLLELTLLNGQSLDLGGGGGGGGDLGGAEKKEVPSLT